MRIINSDIVNAPCFNTMDGKDVNGGSIPPVTDLKFSPTSNDATNSNGILSPPTTPSTATPSEHDYNPTQSNSGRFKFYKDGKFILELWHHKNGERMFWIPVSKNSTCWLPVGHCTPRQESSTSLSVSDDNSSVQSSPWQRDHCWKQTVPRKNINRELEFMMHVRRRRRMRFSSAAIRRRRRRPYDTVIKYDASAANKCHPPGASNAAADDVDEKLQPAPIKLESKPAPLDHEQAPLVRIKVRTRQRLTEVLQKLLERRSYECVPSAAIGSCRTDPGIVSPRKRILKEMEKVSLDEMGGNANKKHRARTVFSSSSNSYGGSSSTVAPCTTVTVSAGGSGGSGGVTAATTCFSGLPAAAASVAITAASTSHTMMTTVTTSSTVIKSTNSHSISSILSRDEEQPSFLRNLLKSPTDGACPVGVSAVGAASGTVGELSSPLVPLVTSAVNVRDIREARIAHSIHCATSVSCSSLSSPPPPASSSSSAELSYPTVTKSVSQQQQPPAPPPSLHPPSAIPTYIPPAYLYHGAPQPFLASPPISNHPPYYPAFSTPASFRDSPALCPVSSISSLGRQSVYPSTGLLSSYPVLNPSPWVPVAHASLQSYPVAENGTDVPLNLSKH